MKEDKERDIDCYCIQVKRASNTLTKLYDDVLRPHDLTVTQFSLLNDILFNENCSKTELASISNVDKSTIARNIWLMSEDGLVYDLSPKGSRESQLVLSKKGRQKIKEAFASWEKVQKSIEEPMGQEKLQQLKELLEEITEAAKGITP